jgi:hypothetical protein
MAEEGMKRTENELIHIGNPIPFDTERFLADLQVLMDAAYRNEENIAQLVEKMVPTYCKQLPEDDKTYERLLSMVN